MRPTMKRQPSNAQRTRVIPLLLFVAACGRGAGSKSEADSLRAELDAVKQAAASRVADSIRAEATKPRELILFSDTVFIPPPNTVINGVVNAGYRAFGFSLDAVGSCTLTGRLEVVAGGSGKDIQIAVFDHDAFINWRNNHLWRPLYASPSETITTLNFPIRQVGTFYLVLSNQMSVVSGKRVTGVPTVTCVGHPIPVAADENGAHITSTAPMTPQTDELSVRLAAAKTDIRNLEVAQEVFFANHGNYPSSFAALRPGASGLLPGDSATVSIVGKGYSITVSNRLARCSVQVGVDPSNKLTDGAIVCSP